MEALLKQKPNICSALTFAERLVSSEKMIPLLGLFVLLCHMYGLAIIGLTGLALVIIFVFVTDAKARGCLPPFMLLTYVISPHTGGAVAGAGVFGGEYFLDYIVYLAVLFAAVLFSAAYGIWKRRLLKFRFSIGFFGVAAMSVSFLSGGFFYDGYSFLSLAIGAGFAAYFMLFFVVLSLIAPALDFEFIAKAVTAATLCLLFQLLYLYLKIDIFTVGAVNKNAIALGWGKSNNIAVMIALGLPFSAYFMCVNKHAWYGFLVFAAQLAGIFLTLSRAMVLVALPFTAVALVYAVWRAKGKPRLQLVALTAGAALAGGLLVAFNLEQLAGFFAYFERDVAADGRIPLFEDAFESFLQNPLFGRGIAYKLAARPTTYFYFVHNTILQFMMFGGLIGLAAVLLHIASALYTGFKKPNEKRMFLLFGAALIFAHSMLDCVWFFPYAMLYYMIFFTVAESDLFQRNRTYYASA